MAIRYIETLYVYEAVPYYAPPLPSHAHASGSLVAVGAHTPIYERERGGDGGEAALLEAGMDP